MVVPSELENVSPVVNTNNDPYLQLHLSLSIYLFLGVYVRTFIIELYIP